MLLEGCTLHDLTVQAVEPPSRIQNAKMNPLCGLKLFAPFWRCLPIETTLIMSTLLHNRAYDSIHHFFAMFFGLKHSNVGFQVTSCRRSCVRLSRTDWSVPWISLSKQPLSSMASRARLVYQNHGLCGALCDPTSPLTRGRISSSKLQQRLF